MSDEVYLGTETADATHDIEIGDYARFHCNGAALELQIQIATVWTTFQTWTGAYDYIWRIRAEDGVVYLEEQNEGLWVTFEKWGI